MEVHVATLKGTQQWNTSRISLSSESLFATLFGCMTVLGLVVQMQYAEFTPRKILSYIFDTKIQERAAVLTSGKRYVHIVEVIKNQLFSFEILRSAASLSLGSCFRLCGSRTPR